MAQFVVKSSIDYNMIYGLATMGMALLTGWIALIAFRAVDLNKKIHRTKRSLA
jgi:hypothetical protein